MKRLLAILLLLMMPSISLAGEDIAEKGAPFVKGIAHFNDGNYGLALESLGVAKKKLPSVADYALLYIAKSYMHTGNADKAIETSKELYEKYPDSPLWEEARGIEVVAALQRDEQGALWLLTKYVEDFPADMEMKYVLASLLKVTGNIDEAKPHLKEIYKAACPLSDDALSELEPEDITPLDLMERGDNLLKNRRYEEAEKEFRTALEICEDDLKPDVLARLADALFRQRKYDEAARLFFEVNDLYNAARALIRDGQMDKFKQTMDKLVASGDPKGANLMLAYAGDLRRKGHTGDALLLLKNTIKRYPGSSEEALWSTGWIHYVSGDYLKAYKEFSKLNAKYRSDKYLYWKARAYEKTGKDASKLYEGIKDDDYYSALAMLRTGNLKSNSQADEQTEGATLPPIERVDLLILAGLHDNASRELFILAEHNRDATNLRNIALRLMNMQEYRKAMLVTSTIPADMRPFEVQYPLAFWSRVTAEAKENGMDPFLLLSLIREESRFDPKALSAAGAVGLMQLMPETARQTARQLKISIKGTESLQDADLNIKLGSFYLNGLLKQFDSVPPALAAYNAGGSRVKGWLSQNDYGSSDEFIEDIPFEETRNYVKRIVRSYFQYWRAKPEQAMKGLKIL